MPGLESLLEANSMSVPVEFGDLINPFRTAVPFWGQTTCNLSGLPPTGDCSFCRVNLPLFYMLGAGSCVRVGDASPTRETCTTAVDHAGHTGPTRRHHELDHSGHE